MTATANQKIRCAIYTRVSTDLVSIRISTRWIKAGFTSPSIELGKGQENIQG